MLDWRWVGEPVPWVRTDPLRLRQVLMNLVGNAVKFTRNGRITLELEAGAEDDAGRVPVTIRVIDTGIGIDPSEIDRMFRDFETGDTSYGRQAGGTGLGLGIARRLTEALGGEIGANSTPGSGSVFWVRLPLQAATPAARTGPSGAVPEPAPTAPRRKILIVEDNEINRTVLREMLTADGHRVIEAHDGRDGVRLASQDRFDLILMDISMPVMDGRAATRAIRDGGGPSSAAEIVAVTAHALPAEIEDFRRHGIDGYLSKPIQRGALRELLSGVDVATPEAVPGSSAPDLDTAHLERLRADLGEETAAALLSRFIAEGDATVAEISDTRSPGRSVEETRKLAHKLAGSAATFGAVALRLQLAEIQDLADAGDETAVRDRSAEIMETWQRVRPRLAKTVQAPSA
jgi:CheY-like chemotaxis protein